MFFNQERAEESGYLVYYRTHVPEGYSFPGTDADQFYSDSCGEGTPSALKSVWVTNNRDETGNGDLLFWTKIGSNLEPPGNGAYIYPLTKTYSHYDPSFYAFAECLGEIPQSWVTENVQEHALLADGTSTMDGMKMICLTGLRGPRRKTPLL